MYKLKMCLHDFNQSINHSPARSHNHKIYLVPISDMSMVLSLRFKCSVFIWQTMAYTKCRSHDLKVTLAELKSQIPNQKLVFILFATYN